jgi:hypothetical protein
MLKGEEKECLRGVAVVASSKGKTDNDWLWRL